MFYLFTGRVNGEMSLGILQAESAIAHERGAQYDMGR